MRLFLVKLTTNLWVSLIKKIDTKNLERVKLFIEVISNRELSENKNLKDVYEKHHIDKFYVKKNYKKALLDLENEDKIKTNRTERKTRKGTFPDDMVVTFPKK